VANEHRSAGCWQSLTMPEKSSHNFLLREAAKKGSLENWAQAAEINREELSQNPATLCQTQA